MRKSRFILVLLLLAGVRPLYAEFLFAPADPSPNGFMTPSLNYGSMVYEYSAWDIFYSPYSLPNFPDKFAPYGGHWNGSGYAPETPSQANANPDAHKPGGGFSGNPNYNPDNPLAFWDTRNPTLTQSATSAFIIGPDISGNIYTFSEKTSYVLENHPDYDQLGSVIFQFQTDGSTVDFSSIKLVYSDGFNTIEIAAADAEYLREYHVTGGGHWSADAGYANRVALQWDMSGITDAFGNPITSYQIVWQSESSSMSFQKADLVTSDTYEAGIPISAAWVGGDGAWSEASHWSLNPNSGLTLPQANGNIKFQNTGAAVVALDGNQSLGEMIFQSPGDVTINSVAGAAFTANTGVTTTADATGTYTVNADYHLGALNFFEINAGTVEMNGVISGGYGLVKKGAGTLVLGNNNSFGGFLGIQNGTVRVEGNNSYTGSTNVVNGSLIVAADAGGTGALGNSAAAINLGADAGLYQYTAQPGWQAALWIDGDHNISRDITLAAGDIGKQLGAFNTVAGAVYSGTISLTSSSANPDALESAAGNVRITAQNTSDRIVFSGAMTGGNTSKSVTLDGQGTVVYSGVNKTYANATNVASGTLVIQSGTSYTGNGSVTVGEGAKLQIDGGLGGSGNLTVNKGRLEVNGTLGGTGTLDLDEGSLSGSGTITRAIVAVAGAVLSPGNSPGEMNTGAQTWGGGAAYVWEIGSLTGGTGIGWDHFNISGSLDITATEGGEFVLRITSLDALNAAGMLAGFDPDSNYSWIIATASGGITGFAPDAFELDTTDFLNSLNGSFSLDLGLGGHELLLQYTAIPEPSTYGLFIMGGALFWLLNFGRKNPAAFLNKVKKHNTTNL